MSSLKSLTPALPSFETLASLTVVNVKVSPIHEGVDGKVEVLPIVVAKVAASSKEVVIKQLGSKGLRLEGTEL